MTGRLGRHHDRTISLGASSSIDTKAVQGEGGVLVEYCPSGSSVVMADYCRCSDLLLVFDVWSGQGALNLNGHEEVCFVASNFIPAWSFCN